jgi:phosphatidylserine/phosphatidylglycerophosphate/cardiolipin synthase-like enzyme
MRRLQTFRAANPITARPVRTSAAHHAAFRAAIIAAIATAPAGAAAQQLPAPATPPPPVVSMGQPHLWQPYASGVATFGRDNGDDGGLALGVYHPIGSPVNGVMGLSVEAYALAGAHGTGGARLLGVTRAVNLGYGVDWDAREHNFAFMLSYNTALRRGGIFGRGTTLRVDWIPPRSSAVDVGLTVPIGQRYAGRTRPHDTGVDLPDVVRAQAAGRAQPADRAAILRDYRAATLTPLPAGADSAIRAVREAAGLIRVYTNFFNENFESSRQRDVAAAREIARRARDSMAVVSPRYPNGRTAAAAERAYDEELERAFALAVGDSARGAAIARRARAGLLEHAILPYDALLGRVKDNQYKLNPLADATALDFLAWLRDSSGVPAPRQPAAVRVHREWLAIIGEVHRRLVAQWTDSRRVWLPVQLALTPEEHDDQAEIDALIARVEGRPFTRGNRLSYLQENDVAVEIARTITRARDYHVLWVHDFAGRRPSGAVDMVGFRMVADVYFPALTHAVARYDSTGHLTTYLLFLDQNFYEPAHGRLWMTILENPLDADVKLAGYDSLTAHLRMRQRELREAVAQSRGLQALAAARGGEKWLRRTVKVNVSITQPSDFTFRSHRIIPPIPLLPDNLMRDHRKIAFYDVTEADPYRGAMVLSGVGIGEHYSSATWQDRGLLIRGPAVLEVRAAARRLLRLNDFADRDIPPPLRETSAPQAASHAPGGADGAPDGAEALDLGRALLVHNEPGFGRKQATVARAMLYSLAPRGSVLVVPDGLWLDGAWAGMLAGAALRGCRVFVIAPALDNAPSAQFPQMAHTGDVILRLLQVRQEFAREIHAAGGELRVGLYSAREDVNDIARQIQEVRAGTERYPWLHDLVPFPANALAVLDSAPEILAAAGYRPFALGKDEKPRLPQLHQKTQFFADSAALVGLAERPEWHDVAVSYLLARAAQTRRGEASVAALGADTLRVALARPAMALLNGYLAARPPADSARMTFYFTLGTQNQDPRGMMLDGEAVLVVSGLSGAIGLFDMYSMMARSTWVETEAELNALLPSYDDWQRRLGRFMRFVL